MVAEIAIQPTRVQYLHKKKPTVRRPFACFLAIYSPHKVIKMQEMRCLILKSQISPNWRHLNFSRRQLINPKTSVKTLSPQPKRFKRTHLLSDSTLCSTINVGMWDREDWVSLLYLNTPNTGKMLKNDVIAFLHFQRHCPGSTRVF